MDKPGKSSSIVTIENHHAFDPNPSQCWIIGPPLVFLRSAKIGIVVTHARYDNGYFWRSFKQMNSTVSCEPFAEHSSLVLLEWRL